MRVKSQSYSTVATYGSAPEATPQLEDPNASFRYKSWIRPNLIELSEFAAELGGSLEAGVPAQEILRMMRVSAKADSPMMAEALDDIYSQVESGKTLGAAFRRHTRCFREYLVEMLAAAEVQGKIPKTLDRVSSVLKSNYKVQQEIREAFSEPAFALVVAAGVCVVILVWVIPPMKDLYAAIATDDQLPLATRTLIAIGDFTSSWYGVLTLAAAAAGIVVAGYFLSANEYLRSKRDRVLLKIPRLRQIVLLSAVSQGLRSLSSGLDTLPNPGEALDMAAKTCGNLRIAEAFREAAETVRQGKELWVALQATEQFPPNVVYGVAKAEKAGTLDERLVQIAEQLEIKLGFARNALLRKLKPTLIILMGGVTLCVLIAVYGPLFWIVFKMAK